MAELQELLNTYKRFPDVPLVLGDSDARLLIAALEAAWAKIAQLEAALDAAAMLSECVAKRDNIIDALRIAIAEDQCD